MITVYYIFGFRILRGSHVCRRTYYYNILIPLLYCIIIVLSVPIPTTYLYLTIVYILFVNCSGRLLTAVLRFIHDSNMGNNNFIPNIYRRVINILDV